MPGLPIQNNLEPHSASLALSKANDNSQLTRLAWGSVETAALIKLVEPNPDVLKTNSKIKSWQKIAENLKSTTGIERTAVGCKQHYRKISQRQIKTTPNQGSNIEPDS